MKTRVPTFIGMLLAAVPVLATVTARPDTAEHEPAAGVTIVGEQEAPLGLFIAPWQDEPASNIDWPPRLLDESSTRLDTDTLKRRVELDAARAAWRRSRMQ